MKHAKQYIGSLISLISIYPDGMVKVHKTKDLLIDSAVVSELKFIRERVPIDI